MRQIFAFALLLSISAVARAAQPDLNQWLSDLLAKRMYSWTPLAFAGPATAAKLGTVADLPVQVDATLPERSVVIRNQGAFKIHEGEPREETIPAGSDMASQQW